MNDFFYVSYDPSSILILLTMFPLVNRNFPLSDEWQKRLREANSHSFVEPSTNTKECHVDGECDTDPPPPQHPKKSQGIYGKIPMDTR